MWAELYLHNWCFLWTGQQLNMSAPGSHSYYLSNKTENIIRQKCDGKSVCDVSVYPVVLQGSNCRYANPYLRLRYKCRKSGKYERPDGSCEIK